MHDYLRHEAADVDTNPFHNLGETMVVLGTPD